MFGSKKKEKIFTWDQARFEEMTNAGSEENSIERIQSRGFQGGSTGDMVSSEGKGPNQDIPSTLDAVRLHYRGQNEEMWIKWNRVLFDIDV